MLAHFGRNDKYRNSTKMPGRLGTSEEILLKHPTSVVSPVITLNHDGNEVLSWNYCHIPALKRYYYIVNAESINAHMWQLSLEVDVLTTYRSEILDATAFVQRSQSAFNTMLPDAMLPLSDTCENLYYEFPFPPYSADGVYVINFGSKDSDGSLGMAVSMVATPAGIANISEALFQKDKLKELLQYYNNPLDMVISAIWMPIGTMFAASGSTQATLGDSDIVFSGSKAKKVYQGAFSPAIELPYKAQLPDGSYTYADYRNVEPYTQYLMELPGVGCVEIPMASFIEDGSALPEIRINYAISILDGKIIYEICNKNHAVIMMCDGNLATPVPLVNSSYNTMGAISSYLTGLGSGLSTVAGVLTVNPFMLATGASMYAQSVISGISSFHQARNSVSGGLGGFAGERFMEKIKITVRPYRISDSPSNVRHTIGLPLYANRRLGSLSGFVKATNCRIRVACTDAEHAMLLGLLESGSTYGGVIIE